MTRLPAVIVLVLAIAGILVGRIGHITAIAIVGYVLLAVALVLGWLSRR
jgi:hypothetical protein